MATAATMPPQTHQMPFQVPLHSMPQEAQSQQQQPAPQINGTMVGQYIVSLIINGLSFVSGLAQKINTLIPAFIDLLGSITGTVNKFSEFTQHATTGWRDAGNSPLLSPEQVSTIINSVSALSGLKIPCTRT